MCITAVELDTDFTVFAGGESVGSTPCQRGWSVGILFAELAAFITDKAGFAGRKLANVAFFSFVHFCQTKPVIVDRRTDTTGGADFGVLFTASKANAFFGVVFQSKTGQFRRAESRTGRLLWCALLSFLTTCWQSKTTSL
jgi:hypothetical protein